MESVINQLIIIWIVWVLWVSFSVYFKWTKEVNTIFYSLYVSLIIAFGIVWSSLDSIDNEVIAAHTNSTTSLTFLFVRHFIILVALTAFLQIAVSWFQQRWHRR